MTREWQPGDVVVAYDGLRWTKVGWNRWIDAEGDERHLSDNAMNKEGRPLVVIDPEDCEQVERLALLCIYGLDADAMQAALREFANPTPPKPRCVAHGEAECSDCSRITSDYLTDDGGCKGCGAWGSDGMHWDTCPGRIRGAVFANRAEAVPSE